MNLPRYSLFHKRWHNNVTQSLQLSAKNTFQNRFKGSVLSVILSRLFSGQYRYILFVFESNELDYFAILIFFINLPFYFSCNATTTWCKTTCGTQRSLRSYERSHLLVCLFLRPVTTCLRRSNGPCRYLRAGKLWLHYGSTGNYSFSSWGTSGKST